MALSIHSLWPLCFYFYFSSYYSLFPHTLFSIHTLYVQLHNFYSVLITSFIYSSVSVSDSLSLSLSVFSCSIMPSMFASSSFPVTQELHSCHQEKLNLQVLRWVFPVSKQNEEESNGSSSSGWSSLYSLSTPKQNPLDLIDKSSYNCKTPLPPIPIISKKPTSNCKNNLDMCTETLGCETGTVYTTDDYNRDSLLSARVGFPTLEEAEQRRRERKEMVEMRIKRVKLVGSEFPPTLTTLSGEKCIHIVREREEGRLIMYAIKRSMIEAERANGRLRLRLLSCSDNGKVRETKTENAVGGEKLGNGEKKKQGIGEDDDDDCDDDDDDDGDDGDGDDDEQGVYLGVVGKAMNGKEKTGEEIEIRKYLRSGRCKEREGGSHGRSNLRENWKTEAFCVASS